LTKTTTISKESIPVAPAAGVWTEAMPESPDEQLAFFKREGFLIIRNLLTQDEVAQLKDELDRLAQNHASLPRIREGFDLEPNRDGSRATPENGCLQIIPRNHLEALQHYVADPP